MYLGVIAKYLGMRLMIVDEALGCPMSVMLLCMRIEVQVTKSLSDGAGVH